MGDIIICLNADSFALSNQDLSPPSPSSSSLSSLPSSASSTNGREEEEEREEEREEEEREGEEGREKRQRMKDPRDLLTIFREIPQKVFFLLISLFSLLFSLTILMCLFGFSLSRDLKDYLKRQKKRD